MEQIGPVAGRFRERRFAAPFTDFFVIAAEKNLGNRKSPEIGRAGVLGAIEQAGGKALVFAGRLVTEDAWDEPCDRVDDERGRKLAATHNKIANGCFFVSQILSNPFVHSFISAADEQEFVQLTPTPGGGLVKQTALRRHESDLLIVALLRKDCLGGQEDGFWFHEHAFAAPEGPVVDTPVAVESPLPEIMDANLDFVGLQCPGDDSVLERTAEELREDGEYMECHGTGKTNSGITEEIHQAIGQEHLDAPFLRLDPDADVLGEGDQQTVFQLQEAGGAALFMNRGNAAI